MLIDNVDISKFNAIQLESDIQNEKIKFDYGIINNSLLPIELGTNEELKIIKVDLLFKGNRNQILQNISNLMALLYKEITLTLDNNNKKYICVLTDDTIYKTPNKRKYKLHLEFKGYCYGAIITETMNNVYETIITVQGNKTTPAIVEITPISDTIDIVLEGLADDPIKIKNLKANKTIILDGELQKVTQDNINKFGDTDLWDYPRLVPGVNKIKLSKNNCSIKIKYKSRFI